MAHAEKLIVLVIGAAIAGATGSFVASAQQAHPWEEIQKVDSEAQAAAEKSCSSEEARSLYLRLIEWGEEHYQDDLADTYNPQTCDQPGTDVKKAIDLYFKASDSAISGDISREKLLELAKAGLITEEAWKTEAKLLKHFALVAVEDEHRQDDAASLMRRAYEAGDESARSILLEWVNNAPPKSFGHDLSERAGCELGKALMDRFPNGEEDEKTIAALKKCSYEGHLVGLTKRRINQQRATVADMIWFLEQDNDFNIRQDAEETFAEIVDQASAANASSEFRLAASFHLYRTAALGDVDSKKDWSDLLTIVGKAAALDPLPDKVARHGDALFAAALSAPTRLDRFSSSDPEASAKDPEEDELAIERAATYRAAVKLYEDSPRLTSDQEGRLAVLTLRGFSDKSKPAAYAARLASPSLASDPVARNTVAFDKAIVDADVLRSNGGTRASGSPGGCTSDNLEGAVDRSVTLYRRLNRSRAMPDVASETAAGLLQWSSEPGRKSFIPEGTAVLLYSSDYLRHCAWLLDSRGVAGFEAEYGAQDFNQAVLMQLLKTSGVTAAQSGRAPVLRANTDPASRGIVLLEPSSGASAAAMTAASRLLLPGEIMSKITAYKRVVVVPYAEIGAFPFAALPLDDGSFLVDHVSIAIAPSIIDLYGAVVGISRQTGQGYLRAPPGCGRDFVAARPAQRPTISRSLVIGDPDYGSEKEYHLPPLGGARSEAQNVAALLGALALTGSSAAKATVVRDAPQADILYFATHGVADSSTGLNGFIALSGGRWTAKEVQNTCLAKAQLVVLSACQTGLGQAVDGGIIGLARGFQLAGASNVVMSLWNVDDDATRDLATAFMARYQAGDEAPEALRSAMLELRAKRPEPRYWASFTVLVDSLAP